MIDAVRQGRFYKLNYSFSFSFFLFVHDHALVQVVATGHTRERDSVAYRHPVLLEGRVYGEDEGGGKDVGMEVGQGRRIEGPERRGIVASLPSIKFYDMLSTHALYLHP